MNPSEPVTPAFKVAVRELCEFTARSGDLDLRFSPTPSAQEGLAGRHLAEDGDADVQRAACGVAAHQLTRVRVGQRQQALREGLQPGRVGLRQRQRQGEGQRLRAAGGEVAEVHGQALVAQAARVDGGQEVPALDQHVAGDGQLHAGRGREQGAVVTHAQRAAARRALEETVDQVEFTHGAPSIAAGATPRRAGAGRPGAPSPPAAARVTGSRAATGRRCGPARRRRRAGPAPHRRPGPCRGRPRAPA